MNIDSVIVLCNYYTDSCCNYTCPTGSQCKVYQPTGEAFCEPSCDLDNGGRPADQTCSLQTVQCVRAPCPPTVNCSPRKFYDNMLACLVWALYKHMHSHIHNKE